MPLCWAALRAPRKAGTALQQYRQRRSARAQAAAVRAGTSKRKRPSLALLLRFQSMIATMTPLLLASCRGSTTPPMSERSRIQTPMIVNQRKGCKVRNHRATIPSALGPPRICIQSQKPTESLTSLQLWDQIVSEDSPQLLTTSTTFTMRLCHRRHRRHQCREEQTARVQSDLGAMPTSTYCRKARPRHEISGAHLAGEILWSRTATPTMPSFFLRPPHHNGLCQHALCTRQQ